MGVFGYVEKVGMVFFGCKQCRQGKKLRSLFRKVPNEDAGKEVRPPTAGRGSGQSEWRSNKGTEQLWPRHVRRNNIRRRQGGAMAGDRESADIKVTPQRKVFSRGGGGRPF